MFEPTYVIIGSVFALVMGGFGYSVFVRGKAWRAALRHIAEKHRLRYTSLGIAMMYDLVSGSDDGIDVSLGTHDHGSGKMATTYAKISACGGPFELVMVEPGTYDDRGTIDFSKEDSGPQPLEIPDFDQEVEIRGAEPKVLEALRNDATLRAEIVDLVRSGLTVRGQAIEWVAPFPWKSAVTIERYERVVALARTLEALR